MCDGSGFSDRLEAGGVTREQWGYGGALAYGLLRYSCCCYARFILFVLLSRRNV